MFYFISLFTGWIFLKKLFYFHNLKGCIKLFQRRDKNKIFFSFFWSIILIQTKEYKQNNKWGGGATVVIISDRELIKYKIPNLKPLGCGFYKENEFQISYSALHGQWVWGSILQTHGHFSNKMYDNPSENEYRVAHHLKSKFSETMGMGLHICVSKNNLEKD